MGSRFNPPPNWPLPDDFVPTPGWRPDPAWGEPPYGWQLWVPDGESARTATGDARGAKPTSATWAVAISLVLAVIGLAIGMQPVSLLSGSGILYVGAAIAAGGAILAFATHIKPWIQIVTTVAAVAVVANIVYVEHQLNLKRQQINEEISNITGAPSPSAVAVNPAPVVAAPTTPDDNALYPPALDVSVGKCGPQAYTGWPQCAVTITNHSSQTCDYLVTLSVVSADGSVKYTDLTAYVTGLAPGQSSPQTAQGFGDVPNGATVKLSDVKRFPTS